MTVAAKDSTGATGSATFGWTVTAAANTVTVANPGAQSSVSGSAVSLQISGTDSGLLSLTYSASGLPPGLSISSAGLISGTPTTAGTYSVTVAAKDSTGATGSATFAWTVSPATTTLSYTGTDQVATGSSFTATATLTSPAASCESSQPVSFTLSADPLNGTSGTYSLGTATSTASGAISLAVSTTSWQDGAYMLTVSYAGTSNCGPSTSTASLAVTSPTSPGQLAFGGGSYKVPSAGNTSFAFVVAMVGHSAATYKGVLDVVTPEKWWFQADVTSYVKSSTTQGLLSGTGSLYWWNSTLNKGRGGWQLAKSDVSYKATANAATKTVPASFGIAISYTPVPPQPTPLPNSAPVALTRGGITIT